MLEYATLCLYIDIRHPTANLLTKWEILREIEGKRDYRTSNIISSLKIGYKEDLQKEYKLLSTEVHPSHKRAKEIFKQVIEKRTIPSEVDLEEINEISDSLKRLYDIFYFLVLQFYPESIHELSKSAALKETISKNNLMLIRKAFVEDKNKKKSTPKKE